MYSPSKKVLIDSKLNRVIFVLDSPDDAETIIGRINDKIVFGNEDVSLRDICEFAEIHAALDMLPDLIDGVYSHDKCLTDLDEHPVYYKSHEDHGFYIRRNTLHTWILSLPMPKMKSLEEHLAKEEKDISPKPDKPLEIKDKPDKVIVCHADRAENVLDQIGIILNGYSSFSADLKLDIIKDWYDKWLAKNE